jgi:hypothetical protein
VTDLRRDTVAAPEPHHADIEARPHVETTQKMG